MFFDAAAACKTLPRHYFLGEVGWMSRVTTVRFRSIALGGKMIW
jgi:hypothetical protein